MHICEDAVKRLKTVGVYYTELCLPLPVSPKPGCDHLHHFIPLHPATLFFFKLSVFLLYLSLCLSLLSTKASLVLIYQNLCCSLEHKVTLCSTLPPTPDLWLSVYLAEKSAPFQPLTQPFNSVASPDTSSCFSCFFSLNQNDYVKRKDVPYLTLFYLSAIRQMLIYF